MQQVVAQMQGYEKKQNDKDNKGIGIQVPDGMVVEVGFAAVDYMVFNDNI